MHLQAVIGACFEAIEDFSISSLDLSITLLMSNGHIADLDAKILAVCLERAAGELGPVATPNLYTMDLMNLTADCLLILTTGVASVHLMNLLMVTYIYQNPLMALGNRPMMSNPIRQTATRVGSFVTSASMCGSAWHGIGMPHISLPAQQHPEGL
jgi:hypothetical protein